MIYIVCFNRSRADGLQIVCSSFFCFCARPGASMVSGVEYCSRATFAPVLVPTSSHYTRYTLSLLLELFEASPLLATL